MISNKKYNYQLGFINSINNYSVLTNNIIEDGLMGKISVVNGKMGLKSIVEYTVQIMKMFYSIARELESKYVESGVVEKESFSVYRHINVKFENETMIQPIPFSTGLDEECIRHRINPHSDTQFLYVIEVPGNIQFVAISNPEEGQELVLPACILKKKNTLIEADGTIVYYTEIQEWTRSYNEMIEFWDRRMVSLDDKGGGWVKRSRWNG